MEREAIEGGDGRWRAWATGGGAEYELLLLLLVLPHEEKGEQRWALRLEACCPWWGEGGEGFCCRSWISGAGCSGSGGERRVAGSAASTFEGAGVCSSSCACFVVMGLGAGVVVLVDKGGISVTFLKGNDTGSGTCCGDGAGETLLGSSLGGAAGSGRGARVRGGAATGAGAAAATAAMGGFWGGKTGWRSVAAAGAMAGGGGGEGACCGVGMGEGTRLGLTTRSSSSSAPDNDETEHCDGEQEEEEEEEEQEE